MNYLEKMKLSHLNIGLIIKINEEYRLLYEGELVVNKETKELIKVLDKNEKKDYIKYLNGDKKVKLKYPVYDKFLVYFQKYLALRTNIQVEKKEEKYIVELKIPYSLKVENELLKYDKNIKEYYVEVFNQKDFYRIYSFMNSEYEIFSTKDYHRDLIYIEGNYFYKKTGLTLNETFFET